MSTQTDLYNILCQLRETVKRDENLRELRFDGECVVTANYSECRVDEEWIAHAERGMRYVGKAIDEERRFIRVNGEVQNIEKVKRVSKESVAHLARHSEYITREFKADEDVVPDKLFTVERLNDYATYENRFLYRLLTVVKEFVSSRRNGIVNALFAMDGKLTIVRKTNSSRRETEFTLSLSEKRQDADLTATQSKIVERLDELLRSVDYYLSTPLMTELSKVDALRNLVTRNNVLKMDKNFKEAVALYDYLIEYDGDGYVVENHSERLDVSDDADALAMLSSFVMQMAGTRREKELERECDAQRQLRLDELQQSMGGGREEYILALQERISELREAEAQRDAQRALAEETVRQAEVLSVQYDKLLTESDNALQRSAELVAEYSDKLAKSRRQTEEATTLLQKQTEEAEKQILLLKARITALSGETSDFTELEREYEALGKLVNENWKGTKKMLRQQARRQLKSRLFGKKSKNDGELA